MPKLDLPQGTIHYSDTGKGPVVVLVHGLLVNGALWEGVRSRLAQSHRVVVPDLPLGSHREPMHPDANLSPAGLATLVADLLDALELTDVTLVGNDTGGAICQVVAADHPQRLGRLVLTNCDAYDNFFPPAFRPLQLLPRIPGALALTGRLLHTAPLRAIYRTLVVEPIPEATLAGWVASARDPGVQRDLGKVLRGITKRETLRAIAVLRRFDRPTLIAWGTADRFFKPSFAQRLAADIPGARLEWIDGARTFTALDAPARLAELIGEHTAAKGTRESPVS